MCFAAVVRSATKCKHSQRVVLSRLFCATAFVLQRPGSSAVSRAAHSTQSRAGGDAAEGPWDTEHSSAAAGSASGEGQEAVSTTLPSVVLFSKCFITLERFR